MHNCLNIHWISFSDGKSHQTHKQAHPSEIRFYLSTDQALQKEFIFESRGIFCSRPKPIHFWEEIKMQTITWLWKFEPFNFFGCSFPKSFLPAVWQTEIQYSS